MAQAVAVTATLNRLGFSQAAKTFMNANGLNTTTDLIGLNDKDTAQILKIIRTAEPPVVVPCIAQKRLNIICYWVNRGSRLRETIEAASFNQAALDAYGRLMSFENNQDEEPATQVKPPTEYKTGSKWKPCKEGATAYFNSIKGFHNIPLAYVIRDQENPDPNAVYQTEHHRLISITPLVDIEFEEDNSRVFDFLKSWTLNGPAWTWMRAFNTTRNGRASWQALINHIEGDAQRNRVKVHAYVSISAAKYYGNRKKFTFETYVTIHQDAYADLSQYYGEIISEEKRVRDLLQGIKDSSALANAAKGTILATPTLRNSFENAVAHLATTLQLGMSMNDTRNVSSSNTQGYHHGTNYQGGRNSNRGGRGGRGRGRARNIYLGSCTPEQWRKLSKEDKQKVYDGRVKLAEQRAQGQQKGNNAQGNRIGPGRGIASVVVQQPHVDAQSQITGFVSKAVTANSNISQVCEISFDPEVATLFGKEIGQSNGDILLTIYWLIARIKVGL
jgi:hypothetical protein